MHTIAILWWISLPFGAIVGWAIGLYLKAKQKYRLSLPGIRAEKSIDVANYFISGLLWWYFPFVVLIWLCFEVGPKLNNGVVNKLKNYFVAKENKKQLKALQKEYGPAYEEAAGYRERPRLVKTNV